ncbi:MAG: flagellar biosynthetic protein FliR [Verrucomicrobia bacterium]|nr:flagellar biosynthetic protein FliR [Verrucomicrobiota bacterium]
MSPTESYFSFYSQLTDYAPFAMLSLFVLGMARMMPILMAAPFFGAKVPSPIKMGLLTALTVAFLPQIVMTSKTMVDFNSTFIGLLFKEFFIGMFLAFFAGLPFSVAESAGVLIDFLRGASSLQVTDPSTQTQSSDIGIFYNQVMIVIFYQIGGPYLFFDAVLTSFEIVPADGWINPTFFTSHNPFWMHVTEAISRLFAVAIQLAAPSLLAILMTELFLGIANRLAPQVQIVFLGMSLKSLAGLALLCIAWLFICKQMGKEALYWLEEINKMLPALGS